MENERHSPAGLAGMTYGFRDETLPEEYEPAAGEITLLAPDYSKPLDEKLDLRSIAILERANAFICTTSEEYKKGDLVVSECAALVKRIKEIHDPICTATNKAHKIATGARKSLMDPINEASKIIDNKLGNYKMEVDRKIAEERRVLEEQAKAEQKKAALAEARRLKKEGYSQEAVDAVKATKDDPVRVPSPETQELLSKNSRTPDWDIKIIDKIKVPDYYKTVNEGAIRAAVRSAKGNIKIPGVEIVETFKTRRKCQ